MKKKKGVVKDKEYIAEAYLLEGNAFEDILKKRKNSFKS